MFLDTDSFTQLWGGGFPPEAVLFPAPSPPPLSLTWFKYKTIVVALSQIKAK